MNAAPVGGAAKGAFCLINLCAIPNAAGVIPRFIHRPRLATTTPHLETKLASSTKYGCFGNNFVAEFAILRHVDTVRSKSKQQAGRDGDKFETAKPSFARTALAYGGGAWRLAFFPRLAKDGAKRASPQ